MRKEYPCQKTTINTKNHTFDRWNILSWFSTKKPIFLYTHANPTNRKKYQTHRHNTWALALSRFTRFSIWKTLSKSSLQCFDGGLLILDGRADCILLQEAFEGLEEVGVCGWSLLLSIYETNFSPGLKRVNWFFIFYDVVFCEFHSF